MANLTNYVAGLVLFVALLGLTLNIYDGFQDTYQFDESDIKIVNLTINGTATPGTGNIVEQLKRLQIIQGIEQIQNAIKELQQPNINTFFALENVGIGATRTIIGTVIFPFQITNILVAFYTDSIPAGVVTGLVMMIVVYTSFILIATMMRRDQL